MGDRQHERLPADLARVAQRLRDEKADLSELELDRIKIRVMARAQGGHAGRTPFARRPLMKSRFVLTTALVFGLLGSGTGALAAIGSLDDLTRSIPVVSQVGGHNDNGSAARHQYHHPPHHHPPPPPPHHHNGPPPPPPHH